MTRSHEIDQRIRERIGRNIFRARTDRDLTQKELAALIGVRYSHVSEWERGRRQPSNAHLEALARELGRPFDWFYAEHPVEP